MMGLCVTCYGLTQKVRTPSPDIDFWTLYSILLIYLYVTLPPLMFLFQTQQGGVWVQEVLDIYLVVMLLPSLMLQTTLTWSAGPTSLLWKGISGTSMKLCWRCGQHQTTATGTIFLTCYMLWSWPSTVLYLSSLNCLEWILCLSQVWECSSNTGAGRTSAKRIHYFWSCTTGNKRHPFQKTSGWLLSVT